MGWRAGPSMTPDDAAIARSRMSWARQMSGIFALPSGLPLTPVPFPPIEMDASNLIQSLVARFPGPLRRSARRGQVVMAPGPEATLIVVDGALALEVTHRDTESLIVDILSPTSGPLNCRELDQGRQPSVLRALLPTSYLRVPTTQFEQAVVSDRELAVLLSRHFCGRVSELRGRIALLDEPDVRRRVVEALRYLEGKLGQRCGLADGTILPVPQTVLAGVAGIARQTVNRVLRDLQRAGMVRIERSMVCLLDMEGIVRLSRGLPPLTQWEPCAACRLADPSAPLACRRPGAVPVSRN